MDDTPVSVRNVDVVSDDGMGLLHCRKGRRDFHVPRYNLLGSSGNAQVGAKGIALVLPRWFVENLGLAEPDAGHAGLGHVIDPSRARRVLVVEDDHESRETLCGLLECWGHHVVRAESGQQALAFAVEMRLDAIVLDFSLPDMDGREFVRALRGARLTPPPQIVAYSPLPKGAVDAREVAVDAFVEKPDVDELEPLFGPPPPSRVAGRRRRPTGTGTL
jgi:CheY-like chemotaxis protein